MLLHPILIWVSRCQWWHLTHIASCTNINADWLEIWYAQIYPQFFYPDHYWLWTNENCIENGWSKPKNHGGMRFSGVSGRRKRSLFHVQHPKEVFYCMIFKPNQCWPTRFPNPHKIGTHCKKTTEFCRGLTSQRVNKELSFCKNGTKASFCKW